MTLRYKNWQTTTAPLVGKYRYCDKIPKYVETEGKIVVIPLHQTSNSLLHFWLCCISCLCIHLVFTPVLLSEAVTHFILNLHQMTDSHQKCFCWCECISILQDLTLLHMTPWKSSDKQHTCSSDILCCCFLVRCTSEVSLLVDKSSSLLLFFSIKSHYLFYRTILSTYVQWEAEHRRTT